MDSKDQDALPSSHSTWKLLLDDLEDTKGASTSLDSVSGEWPGVDVYVGLFFTASWCLPAKRFSETLSQVQQQINLANKLQRLQVVCVSSDLSRVAYAKWRKWSPSWLSVPFGHPNAEELRLVFRVQQLPAFLVLDTKGGIVNATARDDVVKYGAARFPWRFVACRELTTSCVDDLNHGVSLILFLDHEISDLKEDEMLRSVMLDVFSNEVKDIVNLESNRESKERIHLFTVALGNSFGRRVRNETGFKDSPALLLLDLVNGEKFARRLVVDPLDDPREGFISVLKKFMDDYRKKILKPLRKSEIIPKAGVEPEFPGITKLVADAAAVLVSDDAKSEDIGVLRVADFILVHVWSEDCEPSVQFRKEFHKFARLMSANQSLYAHQTLCIAEMDAGKNDLVFELFPESQLPIIKLLVRCVAHGDQTTFHSVPFTLPRDVNSLLKFIDQECPGLIVDILSMKMAFGQF